MFKLVPENCPPGRVAVWVKVRVSFRVGGNQAIAPEENCSSVRVRGWVRVGAIVKEPFKLNPLCDNKTAHVKKTIRFFSFL